MFDSIKAGEIVSFHENCLFEPNWPNKRIFSDTESIWYWIEENHQHNCLLWDQEDQARRINVSDGEIAKNKRLIDQYNQRRNDCIEQIDYFLLRHLANVELRKDAWLNSETAGSIIDRLSIISLKIYQMGLQTKRLDVNEKHRDNCQAKQETLKYQCRDLQYCFDILLTAFAEGRAYFKIYHQFKMYNDPKLNPYLSGMDSSP